MPDERVACVIGVLSVSDAESGRRYAPADVPFVEDQARCAALGLEAGLVVLRHERLLQKE
jgi:hypothetical protein